MCLGKGVSLKVALLLCCQGIARENFVELCGADLCPHGATGACGGPPYCALAHSVEELVPGKFSQGETDALRSSSTSRVPNRAGEGNPAGAAASAGIGSGSQPSQQHQALPPPQTAAYALVSTPYGELDAYAAAAFQAATTAGGAAAAAYSHCNNAAPNTAPAAAAMTAAEMQQAAAAAAAAQFSAAAARFVPGASGPAACAGPHFATNPYTAPYVQPNAGAYPPTVPPPPAAAFASPLAHPKAKTKQCTFWPVSRSDSTGAGDSVVVVNSGGIWGSCRRRRVDFACCVHAGSL